ncbi:PorT family protein [Dysgonomonas sp. Marseille-P4677]|uniref:type IX secretion/gliding motility protein PorT/SprT n=1 Tax=Dysgonomonas sp. Marseille-P4677 TaxID=2364790 RepID=UPI001913E593|nr:porin family protein [Dysgonomonas sp. Marseille-P4677]MBK5722841.1 PorT family protein [Dysgonomonas sp. Marseille-P4677]
MQKLKTKLYISLISLLSFTATTNGFSQIRKAVNQPFADQKMYHLGFSLGINGQDMILSHTGYVGENGEAWFAEIPSYNVGFSVGIVGDRYINQYLNLRLAPSLHLGERRFVFREQSSGVETQASLKANYLTVPLLLKFSVPRIDNYRPYILAGGYAAMDIGTKKDDLLLFKSMDYGVEFGVGCNFYLPLFKLCPELRFSFGLVDLIDKDRSQLGDKDLLKYTQAMSSGKSRMISLIFNFE